MSNAEIESILNMKFQILERFQGYKTSDEKEIVSYMANTRTNFQRKGSIMRFSTFMLILSAALLIIGCTEDQIESVDQAIKDVNAITSGANDTIQNSPMSPFIPAEIKMYAGWAAMLVSAGLNFWQKLKGDLVKKTLKTIVAGVEETSEQRTTNPTDPVKANIKVKMEQARIFDKANKLVDQCKLDLI